jgi:LuxR family maltose regulon positive regulatory protein
MLRTSMALAHLALGELVLARQCFLHACREALSLGALRSIVDQPVPLQPLLQQWPAWRRDTTPDAALDALVQRLHESANAGGARRGASSLIETLSPRELHILKLVADGQSNKEIARGLGIAPETVKTHVSKVFGKLGASNRAQAAAMVATG